MIFLQSVHILRGNNNLTVRGEKYLRIGFESNSYTFPRVVIVMEQ